MTQTWQWYLEPLLIALGDLLFLFDESHINRCMEWSLDHPGPEHETEYRRRMTWGLGDSLITPLWEEAKVFATTQYQKNDHTYPDVVNWYRYSFYYARVIGARWSAHKHFWKPRS